MGDAAKTNLNNLVNVLNKYPNTNIEVQGHTDPRGTDEYNMALSERRAGTVASYLEAQGIAASRVTTKGYIILYFSSLLIHIFSDNSACCTTYCCSQNSSKGFIPQ